MSKRKKDYSDIISKHLRKDPDWQGSFYLPSTEDFIKMRREIRKKATRDLADAAYRGYLAIIGLPANGATSTQSIRKLAAVAISSKKIARLQTNAVRKLDKLAVAVKEDRVRATRAKANGRAVHKEIAMSLGES